MPTILPAVLLVLPGVWLKDRVTHGEGTKDCDAVSPTTKNSSLQASAKLRSLLKIVLEERDIMCRKVNKMSVPRSMLR